MLCKNLPFLAIVFGFPLLCGLRYIIYTYVYLLPRKEEEVCGKIYIIGLFRVLH